MQIKTITMIELEKKCSHQQQPIEEAHQRQEGQESFQDLKKSTISC